MNSWIGTSGFQYPEWKGHFYPEKLPAAKMLPFYAERLQTTEINYTFRRIPSGKTIENWCELTPTRFAFSLKAPQRVTHFAKLQNCSDTLKYFFGAIQGLEDKLGPILFQLPPFFRKDAGILAAFLEELPDGVRAAFEFRHKSWFDDEIFASLRRHNAALCIAESADLSTPIEATANFGYLRLRRGRLWSGGHRQVVRNATLACQQMERCLRLFQTRRAGHGTKAGRPVNRVADFTWLLASWNASGLEALTERNFRRSETAGLMQRRKALKYRL